MVISVVIEVKSMVLAHQLSFSGMGIRSFRRGFAVSLDYIVPTSHVGPTRIL